MPSPIPYAADEKRAALLGAALHLLHEQGFHRTTLADVAARAKVPLGNLYYYFKTKEALAEAVMAAHESALRERLAGWTAEHRDPRARLRSYVRAPRSYAETVIAFGCPHGSLCQELEKLPPEEPLARAGSRLMAVYLDWADEQFRELGHPKAEARVRAGEVVAAVQGTMLLAHTMRSPDLLERQIRRLERGLREPSLHEPSSATQTRTRTRTRKS